MTDRTSLLIVVTCLAFGLNLGWEYAQCSAFFIHGEAPATAQGMVVATLGDVVMTLSLYVAVAAISSSLVWPLERWKLRIWATLELLAFTEGFGVEWIGTAKGRWSYSAEAILIPRTGISIVPVAQLPLLAPLTFWMARRLVQKMDRRLPE